MPTIETTDVSTIVFTFATTNCAAIRRANRSTEFGSYRTTVWSAKCTADMFTNNPAKCWSYFTTFIASELTTK